ncbi:unnamed protein product [Acidocella sp. C78]|uniref:HlyD family secretion protein n=1 Tax=Acidocella sp. C78 TaxID=1671486 RepID=UPI00191B971E|nr:HlyD family secretion protein [Acidocella sp. C78]CAG4909866.1 unnamed protein product [Acidocella sp. C78]
MNDLTETDLRRSATSSSAPAVAARRKRRPFVILALLLIGLAAAGLAYWWSTRDFASTSDAQIESAIHTISARVQGKVVAVLVRTNQHVVRGQVLVRLDPRAQRVALDRAEAGEAEAKADLAAREADLAVARANVEVADASLFRARRDEARYTRIDPRAITPTTRDSVAAALRGAVARADAARQQVGAANAAVAAAQAALKAATVNVADARLKLGYTEIRAPVSGWVARKSVRTGNVVAPGAGLMAIVGDRVWVTANFKETALGRIHPGQNVRVYVDAIPGIAFHARVASIQHGTGSVFSLLPAENATGNYVKVVQRVPVRIDFDDSRLRNHLLAPGMSVEPYIRIRGQ